jgi:hypothetical protein
VTAPSSWAKRRALRLLVLALVAAALLAGLQARPAAAAVSTATSSNWSGYAASGTRFRRVSANWVVPTVTCTAGQTAYSAVWVGLGGFDTNSSGLEQTGIDANCSRSGSASYDFWYEILPAGAHTVHMTVHPGDRVSASVTVSGHDVRFRLRDLTSGGDTTITKYVSSPDVSSADWIVEAPSSCTSSNDCQTLPLSNFGKVSFTHASATTAKGRTHSISSSAWKTTKITLGQTSQNASFPGDSASGSATPSSLTSRGSSFSVTYSEQTSTSGGGQPVTFPGGGPPGGP